MKVDLCTLEEKIPQWLEQYAVPSLSVSVVSGEDIVYAGTFGLRDMENGLAPDPHTRHACASVTKAMTATALGILKDEGKVDWHTPVHRYLPGFAMYDPVATTHLTLADMLSHNSGLPRHDLQWINDAGDSDLSIAEYTARAAHLKPNKGFRTRYEYNNLMFTAAGAVVEAVSGMGWGEFLTRRIFEPLGMADTTTCIDGLRQADNRALPYEKRGGKPALTRYRNLDGMAPCGGVNSTVADMAAWISLNLGGGEYRGRRVISRETLAEIHTQRTVVPPIPGAVIPQMPLAAYAFGWTVQPFRGRLCLCHSGGMDGFSTYATMMPEKNLGMMLFCNIENTPLHFAVAAEIYDALLGIGDGTDWPEVYHRRLAVMEADELKPTEAIKAARSPEAPPSRPLADFAGLYRHKGYGDARVQVDGNGLSLVYNHMTRPLRHNNHDTFEFRTGEADPELLSTVTFRADALGAVSHMDIPLEPSLSEPILFGRVKAD